MAKKVLTRREVLKVAALASAAGVLIPKEVTAQMQKVAKGGRQQFTIPKNVILKIRVPRNLQVITQIEQADVSLPVNPDIVPPGKLVRPPTWRPTLTMDLTTSRTTTWINRRVAGWDDCGDQCGCCVRG